METLLQPLTYITILITSFSGRKFTTVYVIYFKQTVFSPNIPTLIYKSFHLFFFFKRWLCIQLTLGIILWDFASVEKKMDAAKKDCTVVYKLVFFYNILAPMEGLYWFARESTP